MAVFNDYGMVMGADQTQPTQKKKARYDEAGNPILTSDFELPDPSQYDQYREVPLPVEPKVAGPGGTTTVEPSESAAPSTTTTTTPSTGTAVTSTGGIPEPTASSITTTSPGAGWVQTAAGGWVPPDHPLAQTEPLAPVTTPAATTPASAASPTGAITPIPGSNLASNTTAMQNLLAGLLANPTSMNPTVVNMLNEQQKELINKSFEDQFGAQSKSAAARGTYGGGSQQATARRNADALTRALTEGYRGVQTTAASQNTQDIRNALELASGIGGETARQGLAEKMYGLNWQQFLENVAQAKDTSALNWSQLSANINNPFLNWILGSS